MLFSDENYTSEVAVVLWVPGQRVETDIVWGNVCFCSGSVLLLCSSTRLRSPVAGGWYRSSLAEGGGSEVRAATLLAPARRWRNSARGVERGRPSRVGRAPSTSSIAGRCAYRPVQPPGSRNAPKHAWSFSHLRWGPQILQILRGHTRSTSEICSPIVPQLRHPFC